MKKTSMFLIFFSLLIILYGKNLPVIDAKYTETPPVIDGNLADSCWKSAPSVKNFYLYSGEKKATEQTEAYFLYDNKNIYVAFISYFKDYNSKIKEIKEQKNNIFGGDSVELFIDPGRSFTYTHIAVNPAGKIYFSGGKNHIKAGTKIFHDRYQIELEIPFTDLKFPKRKNITSEWGINFCRGNPKIKEWSCWSPTITGFHNPDKFGILKGLKIDLDKIYLAKKEEEQTFSGAIFLETDRTFYDLQKDITVYVKVNIKKSLKNKFLKIQIKDEKNTIKTEQQIKPVLFTNQAKIKISSLKEGKYTLTVSLCSGKTVITETEKKFWKIKPMKKLPEKIEIKNNILYVNNKIFFPIGVSGFLPSFKTFSGNNIERKNQLKSIEEMAKDISEHGFNIVAPSMCLLKEILEWKNIYKRGWPSIEVIKRIKVDLNEVLKIIKKYNLRATLILPFLRSKDITEKQIEAWSQILLKYRENPTILVWWHSDETDGWVERNIQVYKLYKEIDPYRPSWLNVINAVADNQDAADILSTDPYPIPNIPVTLVSAHADRLKKIVGKDPKKSYWLFLQMYGSTAEHRRCPTPKEERCMVFLALNHGIKGLFFHVYQHKEQRNKGSLTEELWQYMKELNYQVKKMVPVYLLGKDFGKITPSDDALDVTGKEYKGFLYIIACNTTNKKIETDIKIGEKKLLRRGKVMFENRNISLKDYTIKDKFSGYEVHIYKFRRRK